jgi:hypothetical protein
VVTADADDTEIITVWFPLTEATRENGCLAVVPRSVEQGLLTHCPSGLGLHIPTPLFREGDAVPLPMRPGSVLLMHRLTPHCSLRNLSDYVRWSFDLRYNPIGQPTQFVIGVGVNPGAINLDEEIKRFEWKVEAGAQYAITQPVFDTDQLRDFLERIEHVRIPVIAGIWPLVSYRNAEFLHNEVPGVRVTPSIMDRMREASNISKEAGRDEGLKIARESLIEVRDVIQGVQVSAPFGNVKYALEVFGGLDE